MTGAAAKTRCRALVAGFGQPGMRDLDFGRQLIRYLEELRWPEGVVVEDLSYAAPLVLHRLQELEPAKVLLVGAAARGADRPGTLRRRALGMLPAGPEEVQRSLEESVQGVVGLDHTLAVAGHWGGLPADTVVIEVEPADCSFGVGFSDELAASFDAILAMVREELNWADDGGGPDFDADLASGGPGREDTPLPAGHAVEPSEGLRELVRYAHEHEQVRLLESHRGAPLLDGLSDGEGLMLAGRSRPWGVQVNSGGDWFDVIPLGDGWFGVVMGDVAGHGVEAAGEMGDLRAAVRAYAVLDGRSPARVLAHLDRLAGATGLGDRATVVYLAVRAATGEVRLSNAGHCPPLVVSPGDGSGGFLSHARSGPLGADLVRDRPEATLRLAPNSTLVLFTDGLVGNPGCAGDGFERIREAAVEGPWSVEDLCDHLLDVCVDGRGGGDDICLLVLRLPQGRPRLRRCA